MASHYDDSYNVAAGLPPVYQGDIEDLRCLHLQTVHGEQLDEISCLGSGYILTLHLKCLYIYHVATNSI